MRRLFSAFLLSLLSVLPVSAQSRESASTILVLDASNSMWGQIDGVNKIVIAREVITDLLTRLPEDMALGLTMYGHNRRNDCSDIETMVEPGLDNRDEIAAIVTSVNPRGRTPLSAAVTQAAEQLRYTEVPATVILVSDGRETCDADPCAVGRALEDAGINFTAHVIGFDVAEPEGIAELQCLAETTGGQFLTASNAEELMQALTQVTTVPAPPSLTNVSLSASVAPDGTAPESPLIWEIFDSEGAVIHDPIEAAGLQTDLEPGQYQVRLTRVATGTQHGGPITVTLPGPQSFLFELPALIPSAGLIAPDESVIGTPVSVAWSGPGLPEDYVQVVSVDRTQSFDRVFVQDGNPLTIALPGIPGDYLLQYVHPSLDRVLADRSIRALPPPVTLDAPLMAEAGSTLGVTWDGPGAETDVIATVIAATDQLVTRAPVQEGSPLALRVPSREGAYELRYIDSASGRVLARRSLTVTPASATLDAPESAQIGSIVDVGWTGPGHVPDQIVIAHPGDDRSLGRADVREGNPVTLRMPTEPGRYELRYLMQEERVQIGSRLIEVTEVPATLLAPATAVAGSTVAVRWTGPDYQNDFLGIGPSDDPDRYETFSYTRDGSPLDLQMPVAPGIYEIRYFLGQDRTVIARLPITVTAVAATLEAPATAEAGSTIHVLWTGPDYQNDFLGVGFVDQPDRYETYSYTRAGSPTALDMPAEPGSYEIRYFLNQDRTVIARHPITVTAIGATLSAPDTAEAGATVIVAWQGPDYANDFVGVGLAGDPDGYDNYTYTRDGSPLRLEMPTAPGDYEIRYFVNQDRTVIARHPITVTAVSARIEAPDTAMAGDTISVTWEGPDYRNDFLGIGAPDAPDGYENYTYTRDGSPARLQMPVVPGRYEIRYFVSQDRSVIARHDIVVSPLVVTIVAPETATVGETIDVTWSGPDYRNDFIAASLPQDDSYETYVYTRDGNPARLQIPAEPGSYEIRYYANQNRSIQARQAITILDLEVSLETEDRGPAGGSVMVRHTGPDYRNDFIAIARVGDDGHEGYTYTRAGNPLQLDLPDEPGDYEIRYVMNQDRRVLARRPFTVTAP